MRREQAAVFDAPTKEDLEGTATKVARLRTLAATDRADPRLFYKACYRGERAGNPVCVWWNLKGGGLVAVDPRLDGGAWDRLERWLSGTRAAAAMRHSRQKNETTHRHAALAYAYTPTAAERERTCTCTCT